MVEKYSFALINLDPYHENISHRLGHLVGVKHLKFFQMFGSLNEYGSELNSRYRDQVAWSFFLMENFQELRLSLNEILKSSIGYNLINKLPYHCHHRLFPNQINRCALKFIFP